MNPSRTALEYAHAVADFFLDAGDAFIRDGDLERGLRCNHVAADILHKQNRDLTSSRIERNLQFMARSLAGDRPARRPKPAVRGGRQTCLHVLNRALHSGGHTATTIRWIEADPDRAHDVALLSQNSDVPPELERVLRDNGGRLFTADPSQPFLARAEWLRQRVDDGASYVVLNIDGHDVIAGAVFGCAGGPPVFLSNHAAHVFWTCASIADVVLNVRGSELEVFWTKTYRGVDRCATVPIPLLETDGAVEAPGVAKAERKARAKKELGIPANAVLILTVGTAYKFAPLGALDFVTECERILQEVPEAFVVAVGPEEDERWKGASARTGSRIRAMGSQPRSAVARIHEAADVYIEGFPFGSTTALLEAALGGIPVVLSPLQCPPPYGTDGIALDGLLDRSKDLDGYRRTVIALARSAEQREFWGGKVAAAVRAHHTGRGWKQHVADAIRALPEEHAVSAPAAPPRTPEAVHEYWLQFRAIWSPGFETVLEDALSYALDLGVRPRLTKAVVQAAVQARSIRKRRSVPLPLTYASFNFLPSFIAAAMFRRLHARSRLARLLMRLWPEALW